MTKLKSLKPYYPFSFLSKNSLVYVCIFIFIYLFFDEIKNTFFKNSSLENFIFLIINLVFIFIFGFFLGSIAEKNKQKIREKDRQNNLINEFLNTFRDKTLSEKEREDALFELLDNKYLKQTHIIEILKDMEGLRKELRDVILERLSSLIKSKARDT